MTTNSSVAPRGTILFIANTDWYLINFRKNLLKHAEKDGWSVKLACDDTGYTEALIEYNWPVTTLPLKSRGINPLRELNALYRVIRMARNQRPDVAHLFTLKCVVYGCLAAPFMPRTRIIGALTGMGYLFTSKRASARIIKSIVVAALRAGLKISKAHLIFQNEFDREEFVKNRLLPFERTSVIRGSGVDCTKFYRIAPIFANNRTPRLLFCGRLIKEKGIRDYLSATDQLRKEGYEFVSLIAGEPYPGNPSSLTNFEVNELKRNTCHEYLGHYDDMPKLLSNTDIVVLPTYYREGTPKVLLEAAAAGCAIITTTIAACDGIVEDGINGFRVRPQDPAALSEAIAKLLDSTPERMSLMSQASQSIAKKRFSDTKINRRTLRLYFD
ncbi:group 1 glycosyl transferase [Salinisphaera sp. S4-8]|uniref:glycosyltransferase family 4 protein n=1 Tax=Salinisphaera sp. S4-8 TaxID=633357 RepID=UPI0033429330